MSSELNYGPLQGLIGRWKGDRGLDIAPEPDGIEESPFYETISFEGAGDLTNAEQQKLLIVRYHQEVFRKSNDEQFHDQFGYLTWDPATGGITHTFIIPRGVGVVAEGNAETGANGVVTIQVDAPQAAAAQMIAQSKFMNENARTVSFTETIVLDGDKLTYEEHTILDIYGQRTFDHIDKSELVRQ